MFRAQQAAKRALAARLILSQEAKSTTVGRRVRRWNHQISSSTSDLESVLTYDPSLATSIPPPPPRFRPLPSNPKRLLQRKEDARCLYDTLLREFSSISHELVKVNGEAPPASWREAAVFKGYRIDKASSSRWGEQATSAVVEEPDSEEQLAEKEPSEEDTLSAVVGEDPQLMEQVETPEPLQLIQQEAKSAEEEEPTSDQIDEELKPHDVLNEAETLMMAALKLNHKERAIQLYEQANGANGELSLTVVREMFRKLTYNYPFHSYQLLHQILNRTNTVVFKSLHDNANSSGSGVDEAELTWLYRRMFFSLRSLDPIKYKHGDIRLLVGSLSSEVKQFSRSIQKETLPELVTALVMQKSANMGDWANHFYDRLARLECDLPPEYFRHLLTFSKFNRKKDLPYYDVLRQTVQGGSRPYPHIVMGAVENMFPYTDNIRGTYIALESVMALQSHTQQLIKEQEAEISQIHARMAELKGDNNNSNNEAELKELQNRLTMMEDPHSYVMDMTALEHIANAAYKRNFVELVLLVWDALDIMGLEATEALYETTILCFARNPHLVENAFAVLNDMEQKYIPSQPFVRAFGGALREKPGTLAKADRIVDSFRNLDPNAIKCTPAALNVLLAAHAWRGQMNRCMELLDAFRDFDWSPDELSFASALESVGKAARRVCGPEPQINPRKKEQLIESFFEATETVLGRVEEAKITPGHRFIRNYVEFLCTIGETTTAGLVAQDFLEQQGHAGQLVDNKTMWRVAFAHAENGNFELARKFATSTSEKLPFMDEKIENIEAYHNKEWQDGASVAVSSEENESSCLSMDMTSESSAPDSAAKEDEHRQP